MKLQPMTRRRLLSGLGRAAFALPFISALQRADAQTKPPKRLVIFFTLMGVNMPDWHFGNILQPINPADVLVLRNLDLLLSDGSHPGLRETILTGAEGNASVDQHIGTYLKGQTAFPSLELGATHNNSWLILWRAGGYPVPSQNDPAAAITRIFEGVSSGSTSTSPTAAELAEAKSRRERLKLVDNIFADARPILPRLTPSDRARLEQELGSWEAIQKRLQALIGPAPAPTSGCSVPTAGPKQPLAALCQSQIQVLTQALACDRTRVVTLLVDGPDYGALGFNYDHHALSHLQISGLSDAQQKAKHSEITKYHAAQFASLIHSLKAQVAEDGTSLFDHTVILWSNEHSTLGPHGQKNMPYLLAGGAGGQLRLGREITYPTGTPHNRLLLTLCNLMGLPDTTFGDRTLSAGGPLTQLT